MKVRQDKVEVFNPEAFGVLKNQNFFILDFKENSPILELTGNNKEEIMLISRHNVIKLNPKLAKLLYKALDENIKDYEKKFGEIEIPKLKKTKRKSKKKTSQSYIG